MNSSVKNLEIICAELGNQLAKIEGLEEKVLQNALLVLEEQGLYAMFLYIRARDNNVARSIENCAHIFLSKIFGNKSENNMNMRNFSKNLSKDPDNLLFVQYLLRLGFSYGLYQLKAKGAHQK